jgi:hypothetical protein
MTDQPDRKPFMTSTSIPSGTTKVIDSDTVAVSRGAVATLAGAAVAVEFGHVDTTKTF